MEWREGGRGKGREGERGGGGGRLRREKGRMREMKQNGTKQEGVTKGRKRGHREGEKREI